MLLEKLGHRAEPCAFCGRARSVHVLEDEPGWSVHEWCSRCSRGTCTYYTATADRRTQTTAAPRYDEES